MKIEVGDQVEFLGFGEPDSYSGLKPGTRGTVEFIDDWGTVHVRWGDGHRLGLVTQPFHPEQQGFKADRFRKVEGGGDDGEGDARAEASPLAA